MLKFLPSYIALAFVAALVAINPCYSGDIDYPTQTVRVIVPFAPVLEKLNKELYKAIRDPGVQRSLPVGGFVAAPARSPAQFGAFLRTNYERFGKLIKSLNIKVQ